MTHCAENSGGQALAEGRGGLLWRLARLHPGWVTLIVLVGFFFSNGHGVIAEDNPPPAAVSFTGFMLFYMGYPLFVLLFVAGRFRSRSPRRPGRAVAAFAALGVCLVATLFAGTERREVLIDAASAGDVASNVAFMVLFLSVFFAFIYLTIGAALALAEAERGGMARTWHNVGTFLQFLYLPFCVYFLHRRVRWLVWDFEDGDPIVVSLPLEALKIERQAGGRLSLLLTERIGWDDFECYAT